MSDNPFAGVEMKQADRARKHTPGGGELAAEIRAGATVEELAGKYDVAKGAIYRKLNDSGYIGDGTPAHKPIERVASNERPYKQLPWMAEAVCADHLAQGGEDLWHPQGFGVAVKQQERAAKAACATCPVALRCLTYALEVDAESSYRSEGIWGGLNGLERDKLRKNGRVA